VQGDPLFALLRRASPFARAPLRWPRACLPCKPRGRASLACASGVAALLLCAGLMSGANAAPRSAYPAEAVKAAYLYRFTGYVDWPAAPPGASFTFAVMNASPVAEALSRLLSEQRVGGRPAQVRQIEALDEIGDAQVLYVGPGTDERLQEIVRTLGDRPVLVVADQPGALTRGATVNFVVADRRVRFEVSLPAAARAGLTMRAGLLSVARNVERG
jgi:hypothetical protein